EVERDGSEDLPALVDLRQQEILELTPTIRGPAGRAQALQRDAVAGDDDGPSLLLHCRPGPPLPVGDPFVDAVRDQNVSTPVLYRPVGRAQGAHGSPIALRERRLRTIRRRTGRVRLRQRGERIARGGIAVRTDGRKARPGRVELVEAVDVLPPPGPVHGVFG